MSNFLYDPERRYRRRQSRALLRFTLWLVLVIGLTVFAYQIGVEETRGQTEQLRDQLDQSRTELESARRTANQALAAQSTAEQAARQWEARYRRDVPTGKLRDLTVLARGALAAGVPADRLSFLVRSAGDQVSCDPLPSRRFILPTPLYDGANTSISFADGRIVITGMGENLPDSAGYDPAQAVTVYFTLLDGTRTQAEGELTLIHSVRLDDREYRFSVTQDEPSFVSVSGERCEMPAPTADIP